MTGSGLQEYGGESPIWGFVRQLAMERWTGQAEVGIDPRVDLYVAEGVVYFAQKVDDAPLGARLVAVGALTAAQLRSGSVQLGTTVSLARLFQREPAVDRDTVELTVDRFTEQLLEQVAEHPVGNVSLHPLRHHPSGIHQWRRVSAPPPVDADAVTVSKLVDAVASLSGEVPVVRADAAPLSAPTAPTAPTAPVAARREMDAPHDMDPTPAAGVSVGDAAPPHLAEPSEAPMSFDPVVPLVHEPAPSLPTLSSLADLTPLPTLGAPGGAPAGHPTTARPAAAAPVAPPATNPVPAAGGLPVLPPLGVPTMDPPPILQSAPAGPAAAAAPSTRTSPAGPAAATPSHAPAPAPAPSVVLPSSTMTSVDGDAKMVVPAPGTNTAGAPPEVEAEAEEIWDMVDELLGLPHQAATTASPAPDKKSRGWLRGRKG